MVRITGRAYLKYVVIALVAALVLLGGCGKQKIESQRSESSSGSQSSATQSSPKLKVALVLPGTINDQGWNATAYEGLKSLEKTFGVETSYKESVTQSDQVEVIRTYASQGYDVIFCHGFEFEDSAKKVAKDFPNVKIIITSSLTSQQPNVASLEVSGNEAGFLAGLVAGAVTKSNVIGYVGAMEIPPIMEPAMGFEKGAQTINPKVTVKIGYIGSWEDAAKAKEMALTMVSQGADVLLGNADQASLGVINAAVEKNIRIIGYASDQAGLAPNNVIASSILSYPTAMTYVFKEIIEGRFQAKNYLAHLPQGATGIVWNEKMKSVVPEEAMKKIMQYVEDMKSGKLNIEQLVPRKR